MNQARMCGIRTGALGKGDVLDRTIGNCNGEITHVDVLEPD